MVYKRKNNVNERICDSILKRISELITVEEIRKWKTGNIISIMAGTGRGKSYWVKNILYAFAKQQNKRILYLIHRKNCIDQFKEEIKNDKKLDTISIMSYQKLETYWKYGKEFDFSSYQYIIVDEFHYFLSDSAYNKFTDISLNMILSQNNCVRIFMSATGNYMLRYINNYKHIQTKDYELPIEYNFIEDLTFFNKDETLEQFVEESISRKEKSIFFIQSAEKAYNLYKKYKKHCLFNCSKSNKHYKYVDKDKINNMLSMCKFEENILITTTVMDSGVNILDTEVKHIICDVKDVGVLIQCIGRKRQLNNKDKICLYIKTINNNKLGGMKSRLLDKIRKAKYFKENGLQEFIKKYPRESDESNIVYDVQIGDKDRCSKRINEMTYFKCNINMAIIDEMTSYGKYGYCKYLIDLFQYKNKRGKRRYRLIDENYEIDLEEYLDSIVGKKLFKDDKNKLINIINLRDSRNRQQKSISLLNEYFEANNLPYIIHSKRDSRRKLNNSKINSNRGKIYWLVGKINYKKD